MPMGILYWLLVILWVLAAVFGAGWPYGVYVGTGFLLVLFILIGWKLFGPPLQ